LSERRACTAVGLQRSVYHYQPQPNGDQPIIKLLLELAWQRPEQGFGKLFRSFIWAATFHQIRN
jgi:putative transposase